jgi:hypothetical protein
MATNECSAVHETTGLRCIQGLKAHNFHKVERPSTGETYHNTHVFLWKDKK